MATPAWWYMQVFTCGCNESAYIPLDPTARCQGHNAPVLIRAAVPYAEREEFYLGPQPGAAYRLADRLVEYAIGLRARLPE